MTRILVVGSSGKLGRMLRAIWHVPPPNAASVTWVARTGAPGMIEWRPGQDPADVPSADVVIALWGVTPGQGDLGDNARLAISAMELAANLGARRVLHCSSSAVYPPSETALSELDETGPSSDYGRAKITMEAVIKDWSEANPDGPAPCIMRLANVAGADSLFATLDRGGPVPLDQFPDGTGPRRSYLAPSDLARSLVNLATCPDRYYPPLVNLSGPRPVAMEAIVRAADRRLDWRPAPDTAIPCLAMDAGRIARLCGELVDSSDPGALAENWRRWGAPAQ
ncbi:NAD-dependent epimerase/dehydratase family protein [Pseudooceanicola sp. C21-150M6]|uniref:NAD-dependent epimerase/dehydratase family protein n=1 Tax=Pseudooceanicola sp. C21-150M6 TaxID=3434355 RepID=UPI003D7F8BCD